MKTHHLLLIIIGVLLVVIALMWPRIQYMPQTTDELTGTWRGGGVNSEGYEWFMRYEFTNGKYELTTGHGYSESGTYFIKERLLDGAMIVSKTWDNGSRQYDMSVMTTEDQSAIFVEGARLDRIEE